MRALFIAIISPLLVCSLGAEQTIQVIGAGISRTSTQSLSLALTKLGFKTLHAEGFHPEIPMRFEAPDLVMKVTHAALKSFQDDDVEALTPALERAGELNISALVDIPWSAWSPELLKKYPRAKVIVTVRDTAAWYRSYWEHFRWGAIFPEFLSHPFVQYWRLVSKKIGCGPVVAFPPWVLTDAEKQACLDGFESHPEYLKRVIPKGQLLEFNVKEGWKPLCDFLGVPVPNIPFPRHDAYSILHWRSTAWEWVTVIYFAYGIILGFCGASILCCFRGCRRLRRAATKKSD